MKFPLPDLMIPLSALWETSRARNARRGRTAPSGDLDVGLTCAICSDGDANGVTAISAGNRQVVGGSESRGATYYRTAPRLRSKKKRFG